MSRLAWMVEANTSSPSDWVEMPIVLSLSSAASHSTASTETLSLFAPPLRSACWGGGCSLSHPHIAPQGLGLLRLSSKLTNRG